MSELPTEKELQPEVLPVTEMEDGSCSLDDKNCKQCAPWKKHFRRAMYAALFVLAPLAMWSSSNATDFWSAAASQGTLFPEAESPRPTVLESSYKSSCSTSCCKSKSHCDESTDSSEPESSETEADTIVLATTETEVETTVTEKE